MRKISVAVTALVALAAFAAPAWAATSLVPDNGGDLAETLHSNTTQTGNNLTLESNPSHFDILFHSSDSIKVNGNGVAKVEGSSGGFTDLTITPISNISFTAFKFNLDIPKGPTGGATNDFTFDVDVFYTGGGSLPFDNVDLGTGNGSNRFLLTADVGKLIDKIVLSDLTLSSTKSGTTTTTHPDFSALEQISFNYVAGVPEPATWAEFILGFGLAGVMLRRRRSQAAAVPA